MDRSIGVLPRAKIASSPRKLQKHYQNQQRKHQLPLTRKPHLRLSPRRMPTSSMMTTPMRWKRSLPLKRMVSPRTLNRIIPTVTRRLHPRKKRKRNQLLMATSLRKKTVRMRRARSHLRIYQAEFLREWLVFVRGNHRWWRTLFSIISCILLLSSGLRCEVGGFRS